MSNDTLNFIKNSSVRLPDGGDTHIHPWENGRGFTVTTRLPGGLDFHDNFRFNQLNHMPTDPSGLRFLK